MLTIKTDNYLCTDFQVKSMFCGQFRFGIISITFIVSVYTQVTNSSTRDPGLVHLNVGPRR